MRKAFLAFLCLFAVDRLQAQPYAKMDYGPFVSATFKLPSPSGNVALRGVAVSFDDKKAGLIFDTEMLRVAGCWDGGFITFTGVAFNGNHGANPGPAGTMRLGTRPVAGWSRDGKFEDPRAIPHGPMPAKNGKYHGLYRHEKGIVFAYSLDGVKVLDLPASEMVDGARLWTRTLEIAPRKSELQLLLADLPGAKKSTTVEKAQVLENNDSAIAAAIVAGPEGTAFDASGERLVLKIPAGNETVRLKVALWQGPRGDAEARAKTLGKTGAPLDLVALTKGGKAQFPETATTKGVRGDDKAAYAVDSLTPPFKNPYGSWMRFGGFDLLPDGRAAVCTWSGDVWIVSGIDDQLDKLVWKRFAAGLFQPLGLKVVDGIIHTLGRDGLMRLHDLNGDGEADFYECFNNDFMVTTNFHEFIFDLHTDPEGNFYFIKGGPVRPGGRGWDKIVPHHGCIFKVSKDGKKLEVVARGFRAPNGMGVGPDGQVTAGDNEGTWTPTVPINWIRKGGFYGVPEFAGKDPKTAVRDNPLCWLPRNVDNSNGGQVWITGDRFGPISGHMLHCSYGQSTLYLVLKEEVQGTVQGGVVPLLKFDSGICRARFYPEKNALYLSGLRGWQTNASKDAGLYRVRYTGKPFLLPTALHVKPGAIELSFAEKLDPSYAADPDNYAVQQWNYRWTQNYGSPHFKASNPKQQGQDEVEVADAALSPDGKTVTLKFDRLQPVMQMKIGINIKTADGTNLRTTVHNTINVVGDLRAEVHPGEFRIVGKK